MLGVNYVGDPCYIKGEVMKFERNLPNYFTSLDAVAQLERKAWEHEKAYIRKLVDIKQTPEDAIFATAAQRAEALGITLGLWKEGE